MEIPQICDQKGSLTTSHAPKTKCKSFMDGASDAFMRFGTPLARHMFITGGATVMNGMWLWRTDTELRSAKQPLC